jgi:Uncharacterized conserved protein
MAPRAYWKGFLRLSLVTCPIALYPATSEREKDSLSPGQSKDWQPHPVQESGFGHRPRG